VRAPAAQTTGTLDVGISTVRYDGFLPSGAASVTPGVRWERPSGTLTARGTYLRFESGHRSLQGSVAGSFFTPTAGRWRGEFSAAAGASRYVDFASFWHTIAEARLHVVETERGAWISGAAGRASYGSAPRSVVAAGAGAWLRLPALTLRLAASLSHVGDTTYTDVESSARTAWDRITLDATLGARVWSRGGGRGMAGIPPTRSAAASPPITLPPRSVFTRRRGATWSRAGAPPRALAGPTAPALRGRARASRCSWIAAGPCGCWCTSRKPHGSKSRGISPTGDRWRSAPPEAASGKWYCPSQAAYTASTSASTARRGSCLPAPPVRQTTTEARSGSSSSPEVGIFVVP